MMKKILIFLQDGVGGAERVSVLFGKSLSQEQYEVKFCLVNRNCTNSIRDFIPKNYSIINIPNAGPLKMMWQLFWAIWREKPYVVFSSVLYLNTKILPFRSLFPKTRFVVRCENYLYTFNKNQHRRIRMTYHRADAIIAQTKEMYDELTEQMHINKDKIFVLQNPIDTQSIDSLLEGAENPYPQNGKKHFVASGRFTRQKGFDLLLSAFCKIVKRNNIDLYIVGDKDKEGGKTYMDIMKIAQDNFVENDIHCLGYQQNPYVYIKFADCFVLSSRWEGLPNVLIESQYLGTPSAAFKCAPVVERIIEEGKNGYLAEKDDVESLALAMEKALQLGEIKSIYHSSSISEFEKIMLGGLQ